MTFPTLSTRMATAVSAFLTICLVIIIFQSQPLNSSWPSSPYRLCRVGERPNAHVNLDSGATHLTDDTLFTANRFLLNFSHTMDEKLEGRLRPKKTGVIWTAYNETLRLPMGISMFHAMHCLLFLREALQERLDMEHPSSHAFKTRRDEGLHTHIPHCFSYITQHIMCLGDSTIEPPWIDRDSSGNIKAFGIDGIGVHHKCKDTKRMIEIARRTQTETFTPWPWQDGDTVESVFGN